MKIFKKNHPFVMKKIFVLLGVVFALLCMSSALSSCGGNGKTGQDSTTDKTADPDPVTTDEFWGADLTKVPKIPQNNSLEGEMNISSNDLLSLIRNGTVEKNGLYRVTDGESLTFTSSDSEKTYSLNGAGIILSPAASSAGVSLSGTKLLTLQNGTFILNSGREAVLVESAKNVTLSEICILGNTNVGFAVSGEEITLSACSISPKENGAVSTGVLASGNDLAVLSCNLQSLSVGVSDRTAAGALIENCLLTDCATGVSVETANTVVQKCTIRGGTVGIQATATKSEISAAMSERYNILVAANEIEGAQTSVLFQNVSNSVILLNKAEKIVATGATNLYVAENTISGELSMQDNNYLIADKNTAGSVTAASNANINGDTLTDLSVRSDAGAEESLLPHINNECFVGMSRRQVRTVSGFKRLGDYVKDAIVSDDIVIVPPGLYAGITIELDGIRDKTIYAYGACHDKTRSNITALIFKNCENISCKGLYFSETTYSNTQGTITKVDGRKKTISFICDPGYYADYSNYGHFLSNSFGYVYKPGSKVPYGAVAFTRETSVRTYNRKTGVNTVTDQYYPMGMIKEGDRIILRTGLGSQSLAMDNCSGMYFEDITVFSTAGFAEADTLSDIAPVMHRYAVTYGPAPLLEEGDYGKFGSLIWTDSYGRTRSAPPLTTSCDAMHSTGARTGIRMISCLEEGMHDDGGNINTYYGIAVSFDSETKTLRYTNCDVNTYQMLPPDFRVGDEILLYTQDGRLIADLEVTRQTAAAGGGKYTVKLSGDLDLKGKTDVIVQNASASGKGFLVDNTVVRNSAVRGFLIQATGGEVKNSTFESLGFGGIVFTAEWTVWPEAGPVQNISIHNNRFVSLGSTLQQDANNRQGKTAIYITAPIASSSPSYCLNKNIQITDNDFSGNFATSQIVLAGVQNVTVRGNTFLPRHGKTDETDNSTAIELLGGTGIEISGNTFPSGMKNPVSKSSLAKNVSGDQG